MTENNRINFQLPNQQQSPLQIQFEKSLLKTIRKHKIAIDKLTEKQVAEVFKQAILSGDIKKQVVVGNGHAQSVVYMPYAHKQVLEHRVGVLEAELARHGIPMPE